MNCLEFKRLALAEPNSKNHDFVKHSQECPDCLKYVSGVRKMDSDLSQSLNAAMPSDLIARLQLNQELSEAEASGVGVPLQRYAMAACLAVALFVAGFMASNQFSSSVQVGEDYETLLSAVVEHLHEQPVTPVWDAQRANRNANTLLASYDSQLKLKFLSNLQFSRICPMGNYKGLHASLDTPDGQVIFAYIKGEPVGELLDATYEGYSSRVKPVKGGNLIIFSRNRKALDKGAEQLNDAMIWDA